jgi:hypothetical protein
MTLQKTVPLVLVMFTIVFALHAALIPPSAIAQEDDEDENLASVIVSEVLDDGGSGDAEDENVQDATNAATEDSNQEQDVDQDNVGEFGDETATIDQDADAVNVAVPIAIPINVQLEEDEEVEEPPGPTPECPSGFTFNPETDQCE